VKYVICIGEALIDFIPTRPVPTSGESEIYYQPHPGGAVANVAVALARLGSASRFTGMISEDAFGDVLAKTLSDNAVDLHFSRRTKQGLTAIALVTLNQDGQREFSFYHHETADTLLNVGELDWSAWEDTAICHAGSVSLSVEPARSATLAALRYTRSQGSIVSFDANIRPALWTTQSSIPETMAEVVAITGILKCSVEEAHYLDTARQTPLEQGDKDALFALGESLLTRGPRLIIITLGSRGAILMTAAARVEVAADTVKVVDTTGAGDAFMGAILHRLMQQGCQTAQDLTHLTQNDLSELGRFANTVAGICCTRYGGILSLPYIDEVNSWQ
jgi:fructokinase